MKTGIFIGRFQPFHEGHRKCVEKILSENDRCIILLRNTETNTSNPLNIEERHHLIRRHFPDTTHVAIQEIHDLGADLTVYIGRDVGYRLIQLDPNTEAISATDLRQKLYKERIHSLPPKVCSPSFG